MQLMPLICGWLLTRNHCKNQITESWWQQLKKETKEKERQKQTNKLKVAVHSTYVCNQSGENIKQSQMGKGG